jgi:RNA polymerase sporulation-specific sigma factor
MRRLPRRERVILTLRFGLDGRRPLPRLDIARALGMSETGLARVEGRTIARLRRPARPDEAAGRDAA